MIRRMFVAAMVVLFTGNIAAAEPIEVFAGIPPAAYLAERIGGDRIHVEVLIQPGQDPHTFVPAPKQIQALGRAKLFFKTGMPFENQVLEKIRVAHPRLIVTDATEGIEKRRISEEQTGNGPEGEHRHADSPDGLDPHVWLSPPLVKIMAANVAAALEKIDPGDAAFFKANLVQLQRELDDVDAKIRGELAPYAGKTFYVFHPAFGYFADCCRLRQEAVEAEGKQPSPKQLRDLARRARSDGARTVFIQPQFDPHSAQTVADAIGGRTATINDMEKDIPANLRDIAEKIAKSFAETQTAK
jgi:zinc transport system substrate-binding protein